MFEDRRRQRIKRKEVSNWFSIFNNIWVDDVISWQEEVMHFLLIELDMNTHLLQVLIQKFSHTAHITFLHRANASDLCLCRQFLKFEVTSHRCTRWQWAKPDINKLLWIQRSMPISRIWHRCWDSDTSGVDCLPNIVQINSTSDLFDQNWR